jgi:hypothetical protein
MIVTGHDVGVWAIGVLGTTVGNILTFIVFTSVTGTGWFKALLNKITQDLNNIDPMKPQEKK